VYPLIEQSIGLEKKLFALADRPLDNPESAVRTLARALFENFEHLCTFVYREGIERHRTHQQPGGTGTPHRGKVAQGHVWQPQRCEN